MAGRSLRPDFCDMHDKLPFLKKSLNQCELEKLERYAKEKVSFTLDFLFAPAKTSNRVIDMLLKQHMISHLSSYTKPMYL